MLDTLGLIMIFLFLYVLPFILALVLTINIIRKESVVTLGELFAAILCVICPVINIIWTIFVIKEYVNWDTVVIRKNK